MSNTAKLSLQLTGSMLLIIFTPLVGSLISFGGLPPRYGEFPAQNVVKDVPFSPGLFWTGVVVVSLISIFILFPRLFGFKKVVDPQPAPAKASLPWWFYFGIILFSVSMLVFWGQLKALEFLDPYMFVPVWWGFIVMLDGIVFRRKGGTSLLAKHPRTMVMLAIVSSVGWFLFEYLNFFILSNWYYPNQDVFTSYGRIAWYMASYTIIFPQIFELYQLFETLPFMKNSYRNGPRIVLPRTAGWFFLSAGIVGSFLMGFFPLQLFFMVWLNPVLIIAGILGVYGLENLFSPIAKGNWTPVLFIGIAMVLSGLCWELVNFGSEKFFDYLPLNPSYWKYSVPYVGRVHLPFSEMPILGYWGYIPYGWICWLQWTWAARLFGFDASTEVD